jgi:hypothetical protein
VPDEHGKSERCGVHTQWTGESYLCFIGISS